MDKNIVLGLLIVMILAGCTQAPKAIPQNNTMVNKTVQPPNSTNLTAPPPSVNISQLAQGGLKMGSDNAPVIMIEFSDYQCQFCRRFWQMNFDTLKKMYIDTGQVQFVYKDFPLDFHNAAEDSAEAVACANEQGKAWEMHDKIFGVQQNVSTTMVFYARSDLEQWAGDIGLNSTTFNSCLESGKYAQFVNESKKQGASLGFDATPAFVIGTRNRDNYVTLIGSLPYGTYRATIDQLLNQSAPQP